MFIAEAAASAGVRPATLRYYERIGLLSGVARRGSGYREFSDEDVRLVRFIRRAQSLGLSLDDARQLATLRKPRPGQRASVRRVAAERLADISARIDDLMRMKRALETLVASCGEGRTPACPILEALDGDGGRQ
jgi:DNA-binding transcriptional MerR regulator